MTPNDSSSLRVLHVTGGVPIASVQHAGGVLQRDVTVSLLKQGADVLVLAPAHRGNRRDLPHSVAPRTVLPEDLPSRWSIAGIAVRAAHRLNRRAYSAIVQRAHPPFVAVLLLNRRVHRALRTADVIDLQWFAQIRLYPLIRCLAGPRPLIVGTFHDVVSQRVARTAEITDDPRRRRLARRAADRARRAERWLGTRLDRSVVLSEKDRGLLVEAGVPAQKVDVLAPRFDAPALTTKPGPAAPTVIFVGYLARQENVDAVEWLLEQIWPLVRKESPGAVLRIVGGGIPDDLELAASRAPGVELAGFVEDLWSEYGAASCSVIPLRDGAGVKFKTIESLVAGVPTAATPIGAEGVGTEEDYVVVSDDPVQLARGIVRALEEPEAGRAARRTAERVRNAHHPVTFDSSVRRIYARRRAQ